MEVLRAPRFGGFCGGVKRAWNIAHRTLESARRPVFVSGELINNRPAMAEMGSKGITVLRVMERDKPLEGTLIMRAHGEGPQVFARAQELGLEVIDATCGIVKQVQRKAMELERQGWQVILYGHKDHPEALATVANTQHGFIVESAEEAATLPFFAKIASIAQTTVRAAEYEKVCAVLRTRCNEFTDQGAICAWTTRAQEEARELAAQAQAMVVVGGRKSSNTLRLVDVCSEICPTFLVEEAQELRSEWFEGIRVVAVTAGASTRESDVEAVMRWLQNLDHGGVK